jgi:hypothetical protein
MKTFKELKEAVFSKVPLVWNDPDPIEGNDYTITFIEDLNELEAEVGGETDDMRGVPILIRYGDSEAEVNLHEIGYKPIFYTAKEMLDAESELFDDIVTGEISYDIAMDAIINIMEEYARQKPEPIRGVAVYVDDITVTDPDTQGDVDITIYKDSLSGGMFGVDASFVDAKDLDELSSPFNIMGIKKRFPFFLVVRNDCLIFMV